MPSPPATLRLILGDQLNPNHSWFRRAERRVAYVLMEVRQETDYVKHHVQKVAAFFAAMRAFAAYLSAAGHRVLYLRLDDPQNRQSIPANIRNLLRAGKFERFEYLLPDEHRLDLQLKELAAALPVPSAAVDTEHFLTERRELGELFAGKKRFLMESFYRRMRKRCGILMDGDKPAGGSWNFDAENRSPYDGRVPIPVPLVFENDVRDIAAMAAAAKVATFGEIDAARLPWPIDRTQALALLSAFIRDGLPHFGTYQDAMSLHSGSLFHSRLSFALNTKMLHPLEVIEACVQARQEAPRRIGLHQVEGFVRQILGWREYMRGVYWALMPDFAQMNYLGHDLPLPDFYWTGETRMRCLAEAVGQSLRSAYAHHIQRLMVTGNFALLAGVHPDEVDAWYLGVYIDAVQWVELPNTRAMSQFADGGRVATKPYVSSANYIRRMSDYCGACAYDAGKRAGGGACPFNSLYWEFFARHRETFASNPRIGMMIRTWDRVAAAERKRILKQAESYRADINKL
ncbi:MAG: cryptochrome/photolyase family protein [Desulfobacterales bacterium]|jgi:deoxyribodipyrimidine photolyase-related protein|nr:cryptochrome/photolyase family protein [Desulfobacterales bacterium]